ncbi:MAG: metalloregulator ArsR/SmtB family transcription factor [Bryobacteraceae bacterium]|nr:metalloregulator ArsR/SmtB family transcription factor [Bryobacteraceae bacterium]
MNRALPLSDRMIALVARRFRALSEPLRLRLLQALEAGEASVNDLAEAVEANQSNVSRHLGALHDAGLVARRRAGTAVYYSIADPMVFELCQLVCRSAAEEARELAKEVRTVPRRLR